MKQPIYENHKSDANGNPTGGYTTAVGLTCVWQDGPLGRGARRIEPNGVFVETVISAAIGRLEHYQASKFNCAENDAALVSLRLALAHLESRTRKRAARGVEGTHEL